MTWKASLERNKLFRLAREMTERFFNHHVGNSAAALTYYMIFAFFPFLIFITSLLGVLRLPPVDMTQFSAFIPQDIIELINSFLVHVQSVTAAPLMIFGLVFAAYFPLRAVSSLMDFLSLAYEVQEKRGLIHRGILILLFTIGLVVVFAASILILLLGRGLLSWASTFLPLSLSGIEVWNILRFLLLGAMLLLLLTLLYLVAPGCVVSLREALPGALGSLVCWLCYTVGFSFYVEHMGNYSVVYGSIGAIIVLLIWLYATSVTIIMGAELNASLRKLR